MKVNIIADSNATREIQAQALAALISSMPKETRFVVDLEEND